MTFDHEFTFGRVDRRVSVRSLIDHKKKSLCSSLKFVKELLSERVSDRHLAAYVIARLRLHDHIIDLFQVACTQWSFARWQKSEVATSDAFCKDARRVEPVVAIQSEHQQFADGGVVFEIRADASQRPRSQ